MKMIEELKVFGIDIDDAMQRFMNNEALYIRMLGKLPKAVAEQEVLPLLESGDYSGALTNAHTIKGVMGNLSITPLYRAYSDAVQLLREDKPELAKTALENVVGLQSDILNWIEANG
jgi:HPt (histidine-containing phosphotransfer) domain-containing protein